MTASAGGGGFNRSFKQIGLPSATGRERPLAGGNSRLNQAINGAYPPSRSAGCQFSSDSRHPYAAASIDWSDSLGCGDSPHPPRAIAPIRQHLRFLADLNTRILNPEKDSGTNGKLRGTGWKRNHAAPIYDRRPFFR